MRIVKIHPLAKTPTYATAGSACFDLYAASIVSTDRRAMVYGTGLVVEVPHDHVLLIFSRSGHGFKSGIRLANCVGVIDSDYRGEILVKLTSDVAEQQSFPSIGERVAQGLLLPIQQTQFEEVEMSAITTTERAAGGFGSTGS